MIFANPVKWRFGKEAREAPASSPGAGLIGNALRQQRESLGLDLSDVAGALKIKAAYLAALEVGCPEQLPGPAYALGFLRSYAAYLGLNGDEILERIKQDPAAFARKPNLAFPMPLGERSIPGSGMLLVAAILAICGYGTWYYLSTAEQSRPQRVAEVPAELLPPTPEPPVARPTEASAAARVVVPAAQDAPAPAETANATSEPISPPAAPALSTSSALAGAAETATQTGALAPISPPQSASAPSGAPTRIVLHAVADSWVQIRDAGQAVVLARLLKAGETYLVPDRPGLSMRTGNAGGLEITVDGNPAPSIGPMGAVRRNVVLEPGALVARTAVRP